jgi:hypothetical protein
MPILLTCMDSSIPINFLRLRGGAKSPEGSSPRNELLNDIINFVVNKISFIFRVYQELIREDRHVTCEKRSSVQSTREIRELPGFWPHREIFRITPGF